MGEDYGVLGGVWVDVSWKRLRESGWACYRISRGWWHSRLLLLCLCHLLEGHRLVSWAVPLLVKVEIHVGFLGTEDEPMA